MSSLTVICITNGERKIIGKLQKIMIEVSQGTFVWKLTSKKVKELWDEIKKTECKAVCIFAAKNECGFVIDTHGVDKREVVFNFGLPLIRYKKGKNFKNE